jgi:hypothetical protein
MTARRNWLRQPNLDESTRRFTASLTPITNPNDDELSRNLICGEDRHKLGRAVFHGKRGELRQRYREGQEDQLGALGLVVNIIVLWNTLYIDAIVQQLRAEGFPVQQEDVGRLSPLIYEHINLLGRVSLFSAGGGSTYGVTTTPEPGRLHRGGRLNP